jgi:hypothetical protein
MKGGVQVFAYPEELDAVEPAALAEQVLELGCDTVSMALTYHRARRVFPRQGRVAFSPGGAVSFTPSPSRYGRLVPEPTASAALRTTVERFREAARTAGLRFHAWLVALHSEPLVFAHPDLAAQTVDGTPTDFALCPSNDEVAAYVAALVGDVCDQLEPDGIDLEAALYSAWDPAYTLTLSLDELSDRARLFGAQCFCPACLRVKDLQQAAGRVRAAAGPPFGNGADVDHALAGELSGARAAPVGRLLVAAASQAHAAGASLCVTASGSGASVRLRGLSPASVAAVDGVLFGCATLTGATLAERLAELAPLAGDRWFGASLNWSPLRTPAAFAADALLAATTGARRLALYNLSLVPEAGLEAFRAAAGEFAAR